MTEDNIKPTEEKTKAKKYAIMPAFVVHFLTPPIYRPEDETSDADFAKKYNVTPSTLSRMKRLPEFWKMVDKEMLGMIKIRNQEVINNLYALASATKDTSAIKLYLQHQMAWSEKVSSELSEASADLLAQALQELKESRKDAKASKKEL